MYISKFQVINYKSFLESRALEFTPGFNIVSGQNSSGKTALLEGLGLAFVAHPHRSLKTVPARDRAPYQESLVDVSFTLSPQEVKELMLSTNLNQFSIGLPDTTSQFAQQIGFRDYQVESLSKLLNFVFSQYFLTFSLRFSAVGQNTPSWSSRTIPAFGLYEAHRNPQNPAQAMSANFRIDRDGTLTPTSGSFWAGLSDFGAALGLSFQKHVYRFAAERMKVGIGPHGENFKLAQDASNLPEVLNQLQHNPSRFRELNENLKSILPQVQQVSVRATSHGTVQIIAWNHDPETQREDLAIPLADCGTGIGQVLAILYVVMTSERPQTIIIDEPQSFLHPGAARKLIEFLKDYSQHQYIIATHSATIISAANPKTITLARLEGSETTLVQLDAVTEKGIVATLTDLGVRLSDTFGADNILWVEGATEEKCFRIIVEKLLSKRLMGTEILGVRQTGDLDGRDAKGVFEIYGSLTKGASLLPPALAFVLDRECRSEDAKKELNKLSGNLARYIPRRMYENYLLNPEAIVEVANSIEGFRPLPLKLGEVQNAIESRTEKPTYYCDSVIPESLAERIKRVDGARILSELFNELSETRVKYEKIKHGIALTESLIKSAPADLEEILSLLRGVPHSAPQS
jgi:predicted ATPase